MEFIYFFTVLILIVNNNNPDPHDSARVETGRRNRSGGAELTLTKPD